MTSRSILVVEDEEDIAEAVRARLASEGFDVRVAGDGPQALEQAASSRPDLVVLDLMLPGIDGLEVTRRLRAEPAWSAVPIIMLTAKADEVDRVVGLELGADDYVAKPFSPRELVARVRAVLRRARPSAAEHALSGGGVTLDPARHRVAVGEASVDLTPKEFDLLHALMAAPGRVLSREHLLNHVWGYARAEAIESRTVDVHVRRLRAKLGDAGRRIATVKSIGYRFDPE